MSHKDIIKLNLGCGPSGIGGWINYDWGLLPLLSKMPYLRSILVKLNILPKNYEIKWAKIKLVDIRKQIPMKDESVDYIYCSHVLEHFERHETISILNECKRVLKARGVMRIVLPDLKIMVKNYKNADTFNRDFYGYEKDKQSILNYFIRGHQWMYDEKSIVDLLKKIYKDVKLKKFGDGSTPDLDKLDLKIHKDHSLYVEVAK